MPDNYAMFYATMFFKGLVEFVEESYPNRFVGELIKESKEKSVGINSLERIVAIWVRAQIGYRP